MRVHIASKCTPTSKCTQCKASGFTSHSDPKWNWPLYMHFKLKHSEGKFILPTFRNVCYKDLKLRYVYQNEKARVWSEMLLFQLGVGPDGLYVRCAVQISSPCTPFLISRLPHTIITGLKHLNSLVTKLYWNIDTDANCTAFWHCVNHARLRMIPH